MLTLAIDTATPAVTAGVCRVSSNDGVELLADRATVDARRHSELLAVSIRSALDEAGVSVSDLAAVVVGVGPGPFTGLRVGIVTAAAIADAAGLPAYGVCSLDGIVGDGRMLVATDARRKEIYWASYVDGHRVEGPAVDKPAEVADRLPELGVDVMAGAGAAAYVDVLGLPLVEPLYPSVPTLVAAAADRILAGSPGDTLTPLYLRRPDATPVAQRKQVTPQ